jgi:hypothetical protein
MSYKEIRQSISKKDCNCAGCGKNIKAGSMCVIDPKNKKAYCLSCGKNKK